MPRLARPYLREESIPRFGIRKGGFDRGNRPASGSDPAAPTTPAAAPPRPLPEERCRCAWGWTCGSCSDL